MKKSERQYIARRIVLNKFSGRERIGQTCFRYISNIYFSYQGRE